MSDGSGTTLLVFPRGGSFVLISQLCLLSLDNQCLNMRPHMIKPTMWFPNRSYTNQTVQSQKMARDMKFRIYEEEEVYYLCRENKGADQLHSYREADLRLCFCICRLLVFS